jgi:hypothetical protein
MSSALLDLCIPSVVADVPSLGTTASLDSTLSSMTTPASAPLAVELDVVDVLVLEAAAFVGSNK